MGRHIFRFSMVIALAVLMVATGCRSKSASAKGARQGAAGGAVGGAVGGFFWGLLSGNPIEGAAKGAVAGAGTGAVLGGLGGARTDRELKKQYGETNYEALVALVHREYGKARELLSATAEDPNPKYRHASAWISALIARETLESGEMEPYYEKLIELDSDIETREDAKVEVRLAERDLKALRREFNVR